MRKLVMLAMWMTCVLLAQAQWRVTPEAGMNVTRYKGDVAKVGFKAGAAVSYTFGPGCFSLQSGLYYVRRGKGLSSYDEIYGTSESLHGGRENTSLFLYPSLSGMDHWIYGSGHYGNGYYGGGSAGSAIYGIKDFEVEGIRHYRQKERRGYIQLPVLARFDWPVGRDARLHLAAGPYLAVGLGGKGAYGVSDHSLVGKLPYDKELSYNPFSPGQGYAAAPRLDWGAAAEAGIELRRVAFKVGYDLGVGKRYKGYAYDIGLNYHTASFTLGYTF